MTCGLLIYFVDNKYNHLILSAFVVIPIDQMDWLVWGAKLTATAAVRAGLNFAVPGSAAVADFAQAAYDLYQGEKIDAAINGISGVGELVTFGFSGYVKEAVKRSGKAAAVSSAKEMAKQETCKKAKRKIGQQLSKVIAIRLERIVEDACFLVNKVTLTSLGHKGLMGFISSGGHNICENVSGSLCEETVKGLCELTKQNTRLMSKFQVFPNIAKTAAEREFKKNYPKLLALEYGFATLKGVIRAVSKYFE